MRGKTFLRSVVSAGPVAVGVMCVLLGGTASSRAQAVSWSVPTALNSNASHDNGSDYTPVVATNRAGTWIAAWVSYWPYAAAGDTQDPDVLFSRSTDNGVTWSTPAALASDAGTTASGSAPKVVWGGGGVWVAVWNTVINGDTDVVFSRSTDNGVTWSARQVLNSDAATDSRYDYTPELATDGAGNWVATWNTPVGFFTGDADCYYSRSTDNGVTWSPVADLSPNTAGDVTHDMDPRVASLGGGKWIAAYTTYDDLGQPSDSNYSDIAYRLSTDNGQTWSTPQFLNTDYAGTGYNNMEQIAASGNTVVATFTSPTGMAGETRLRFARSTNGGSSFSPPQLLSRSGESWPTGSLNEEPSLFTDGAGRWIVAWNFQDYFASNPQGDRDLMFVRSTDDASTFTAQAAFNSDAATDSGFDGYSSLAADGAGVWVSVWQTTNDRNGTIGNDGDILVMRSTDSGATWGASAVLNAHAGPDSGRDDSVARLASDGGNVAMAVWESSDLPDRDIKFAKSTNGGVTWSVPADVQTNAGVDGATDQNAEIAFGGGSSWVVAWQTSNGSYSYDGDIFASRTTNGGASWSAPAPLSVNPTGDALTESRPKIATNRAGTAIAVWESFSSDRDVLVARSTDGGATWSAPVAVNPDAATDSVTDQNPAVEWCGGSTWLVAWSSSNTLGGTIGSELDLLVSRSTDNGVTWSAPTALNTDAATDGSTNDSLPVLTSNGSGSCLAVWTVSTNSTYVVRTARSTDSGATWSTPVSVATTPNSLAAFIPGPNPRAAYTGNGGWVLVFGRRDPGSVPPGGSPENDIYYCVSANNGASWSTPALLNSTGVQAGDGQHEEDPSVAATSSHWLATWTLYCGSQGGPYGVDRDVLFSYAAMNAPASAGDWALYQ